MTIEEMINRLDNGHEKTILLNWQGYKIAEILRLCLWLDSTPFEKNDVLCTFKDRFREITEKKVAKEDI